MPVVEEIKFPQEKGKKETRGSRMRFSDPVAALVEQAIRAVVHNKELHGQPVARSTVEVPGARLADPGGPPADGHGAACPLSATGSARYPKILKAACFQAVKPGRHQEKTRCHAIAGEPG